MRPVAIVPVEPSLYVSLGISEVLEAMLPDALLLEASEEALDEAILFRRIGRDEFLPKSVIAARSSEPTALEDEAVVASQDRLGSVGPESSEASQASLLESSFRLSCSTSECEFVSDHFPVVAVDDHGEVSPAVAARFDVGHVHSPSDVAAWSSASARSDSWPSRYSSLVNHPALDP